MLKEHDKRLNDHEKRLGKIEATQEEIKGDVKQIKGGVDILVRLKGFNLPKGNPGNADTIKMDLRGRTVKWFIGVLFTAIAGGTTVGVVMKILGVG